MTPFFFGVQEAHVRVVATCRVMPSYIFNFVNFLNSICYSDIFLSAEEPFRESNALLELGTHTHTHTHMHTQHTHIHT
jgi:hypothetical protein